MNQRRPRIPYAARMQSRSRPAIESLVDPNDRTLNTGGKIVALPAAALKGILRAMEDPNQ